MTADAFRTATTWVAAMFVSSLLIVAATSTPFLV